ncbi:MAG: Phosphomannomutase [Claussenomyces sp. TS43310]|nr:MAG: Phosphomannomutase [Claussenomyces sp. TS43310]
MVAEVFPALDQRPIPNTICLFDVDYTLTLPRRPAAPEMLTLLSALRRKVATGYVSGSDFAKQQEQLGTAAVPVTARFDFCFAENGLTAYRSGVPLASQSFLAWVGEAQYQRLVRFILHYVADLDIPIKRGTFVEFRNGMMNVSPIGRNASLDERNEFERYDAIHRVRATFVAALQKEFAGLGLTYSIGGQISFDIFPTGWDKTYCLQHLEREATRPGGIAYTTIHFFGDRTFEGGNDYEIFSDPRTIGHSVTSPEDTAVQLKQLFDL